MTIRSVLSLTAAALLGMLFAIGLRYVIQRQGGGPEKDPTSESAPSTAGSTQNKQAATLGTGSHHPAGAFSRAVISEDPQAALSKLMAAAYFPGKWESISLIFETLAREDLEDAKAKALTLPGIVAQARAWEAILNQVKQTSLLEAVTFAEGMKGRHPGIYRTLFGELVEESPAAAAEYLKSKGSVSQNQARVREGMRVLVEAADLETALEWANDHFGKASDPLKVELLGEHSTKDPQQVVALAAALPNSLSKSNLYGDIARNWSREDAESAVEWLQSIDHPQMQMHATQSAIPSIQDPVLAESLAKGLLSKSAYEDAMRSIGRTRTSTQPKEEVVEWIQQLPDAALRGRVTTDLIQSWAYEDPAAAAEYALSQSASQALTVERLASIGSTVATRGQTPVQTWLAILPETIREAVSEKLSGSSE